MREKIEKLINSDESAYSIGLATGLDPTQINRLRRGERKIENLSLKVAEVLYEYQIEKEEE